jgi:hypothetical protein
MIQTVTQETAKSKTASNLDSLFFPVEIVNLYETELFNDIKFCTRYSQAIYLPFFEKVVNFAGSNYQLTTNQDFFLPIYEELTKTFGHSQITVKTLNEDDCRFSADFIIQNKELKIADKDCVNLMVKARNSYDGTTRASLEFLTYRQICSNGLCAWIPIDGLNKDVLKHNTDISQLIMGLGKSIHKMSLSLTKFEAFTDRMVTGKELDQVMQTIKDQKGSIGFPKKIISEVPAKIAQEMKMLDSFDMSAWQLYNGFNYFLNHDSRINLRDSIKAQIDIQVKDTIIDVLGLNSLPIN